MALYRHWVDYVRYAVDCHRVRSREQRLDISDAVRVEEIPVLGVEVAWERGIVERQLSIDFAGELEALEVDDFGDLIYWTEFYVAHLFRLDTGLEKLKMLPRNPRAGLFTPPSVSAYLMHSWTDVAIYHSEHIGHVNSAPRRVPCLLLPSSWTANVLPDDLDLPWLIQRDQIERVDDSFEAFSIDNLGHVCVWTSERVFGMINESMTENFYALPRNPPTMDRSRIPIERIA